MAQIDSLPKHILALLLQHSFCFSVCSERTQTHARYDSARQNVFAPFSLLSWKLQTWDNVDPMMTVWLREHELSPVTHLVVNKHGCHQKGPRTNSREDTSLENTRNSKVSVISRIRPSGILHTFFIYWWMRSAKTLGVMLSGSADGFRYVQMRRSSNRKQVLYVMKSEEAIKNTQQSPLRLWRKCF